MGRKQRAQPAIDGGDYSGDNLQIKVGRGQTTGRIGLEFSHPVSSVRLSQDRARELALGILRLCDAPLEATIINPGSH